MAGKATIQDIAKRAGVGIGTVSRVLNEHPNVSQKTRLKVLRAIEDLSFRPNSIARHLRTQRSHLIGFLTDEVATTPYAGDIIRGAQDTMWGSDRILLMVSTGSDRRLAEAVVKVLLDRDVEGILYAAMYHHAVTLPDSIHNVPTVTINCFAADHSLPSVVPNEELGGLQATGILLGSGHRRIGFININGLDPGIPASIGRFRGYQQALQNFNVPFDEQIIRHGQGIPEDGYRYTLELMQLPAPPTAIFCGNDRTAMGAYNALIRLGLHIPDDVAVIGFDNQDIIAGSLMPTLTTMQLPHYEMGQWAASYLLNQIDADQDESASVDTSPIQHLIDCVPVIRQSI